MRLHRFYTDPSEIELKHDFWLHDPALRNQWLKVFRYREGDQVVLFDGVGVERLYKIAVIENDAVKLELVTDFERKLPKAHIYLFFGLLKKDKNDWIIQKCSELGVSNFIPIIADRSEKTGFNMERASKISIEASEQCGRGDIPNIREPLSLATALKEYEQKLELFFCDETTDVADIKLDKSSPAGIFIGPEGGWSPEELESFTSSEVKGINLGHLTLRAETAAVTAVTKLMPI